MMPVTASAVDAPLPSLPSLLTSPRGRKRPLDDSGIIFQKRHSHSDLSDDDSAASRKSGSPSLDDDRRAHHNELERRRRDHIKDHFMSLKDAIPLLEGEKSSRALILKRAVEYISLMQTRLSEHQLAIEQLKRRNEQLSSGLLEKKAAECHHQPPQNAFTGPATSSSTLQTTLPFDSTPLVSAASSVSTPSSSSPVPSSSFTPVVPSSRLHMAPSSALLPDLATLLSLAHPVSSEPANALLQKELSLLPDLQRLLTLNTFALKEHQPHVANFASQLLF